MAHDILGKPLKEGDHIVVLMVVKSVSVGKDYCNVTAESFYGREPDGHKEIFTGNSAVVIRANHGDKEHKPARLKHGSRNGS